MVGTRTRRCFRFGDSETFEEGDAGFAHRLRIRHDMSLAYGDEVLGVEEAADLDLMLDGPAARLAELARSHCLLNVGQSHPRLLDWAPAAARPD